MSERTDEELEPRYEVECVFLANQAAAFLRISCSRSTTLRRSWTSSAFSLSIGRVQRQRSLGRTRLLTEHTYVARVRELLTEVGLAVD